MNFVDTLYAWAPSPTMLLLIIAVISLLESLALVGLLLPGVVLLTAAASLAGHQEIAIFPLLTVAFIGAVAGDSLSFWLGYSQREKVSTLWPLSRYPQWLEQGQTFFNRYGALSILIGRFVGPVRPVIPLVGGMMHMSPRLFLAANMASALLWAPAYILPGYLLGHAWQNMAIMSHPLRSWVIGLGILLVVLAIMFSWLRLQLQRGGRVYGLFANLARHSRLTRALWLKLTRPPNSELPLASWLLLLTSLTALAGLSIAVIHANGPFALDTQLHQLVIEFAQPGQLVLANTLDRIGDLYGILAIALPWAIWMLWRKRIDLFAHWSIALIAIALINTVGKISIGRSRPWAPEHLSESFSYPSAHASTTILLLGLMAGFIANQLPTARRYWAYWAAILAGLVMALSRVLLGVHWLSDIIGGALLGLVISALTQISWQRVSRPPLNNMPWKRLLLASVLMIILRLLVLGTV
ncbi:bifunctional DedA family/phosphatase PAP2 family protein [Halomonas halocynthiae]|uniref:bifunctional DedA family/phosphatase PAP2 family protein n=1 Tax=Halomonas halocynthiae TaxID=176290 RepID=UPI0004231ECB|nr:bifunctional DedA family/phosphatase PAP2 family protein [Halomonas halocynthiae]